MISIVPAIAAPKLWTSLCRKQLRNIDFCYIHGMTDLAPSSSSELDADSDSYAAFVDAMAAGDEQALNELYSNTVGKMYGIAVRILHDEDAAEEIVTQAYFEAWSKASTYDRSRGRPLAWLLTICRSRALDEYRRRNTTARRSEVALEAEDLPSLGADAYGLLEALEQNHVIHDLLQVLTSQDQQLLGLAFFRDLSHQQIAEFTGMPLGSLKSRIRRALATLEKAANNKGVTLNV